MHGVCHHDVSRRRWVLHEEATLPELSQNQLEAAEPIRLRAVQRKRYCGLPPHRESGVLRQPISPSQRRAHWNREPISGRVESKLSSPNRVWERIDPTLRGVLWVPVSSG